jgi:hypothetical protein
MIAKKDAEHRAKLGKKPVPNMYDKKFSLNKKKDESVGKTAGDHGYYHLQKAKELAKKDGHDYDKLPQYDRGHDKHKDHYDSKAKKESVKSESVKYHIPESIPANERTAFHGAAAAAAKSGKTSFSFNGKSHPVTMKKDTARAIADQKESTMTFREKLLSLYEGDRAAHYKGATKPEEYDEKQKSSKGAMDMMKTPKTVEADGMKAAKDTAAAIKKSAPGKKMRKGDQNKGDLSIKPSATPVNDPSAKIVTAEEYGMFGSKISNNLLNAVAMVEDMNKTHTVDIDHMTGTAGSHEKKHGITLKKSKNYDNTRGSMSTDATGTKANLQKYLKKHYDGDHKAMHPEIYKESIMQTNNQVTNEDVSYHKAMKNAHSNHSYAHESEVTNDGHSDHDYAGNEHGEAANHHQKAIDAHKKHGGDSSEYKKAAATAHKQTAVAHDSSKDAGKFKKTAKPGIKFPKKPN